MADNSQAPTPAAREPTIISYAHQFRARQMVNIMPRQTCLERVYFGERAAMMFNETTERTCPPKHQS